MEFAALDFETTGYENGGTNEPWQLGLALVRDGAVVETHEWFFSTSTPTSQPSNLPTSQPPNFSTSQPLNFSTSQLLNLSTSQPLNFSTSQPLNLSTSQPLNFSTSQPLNLSTSLLDSFEDWSRFLVGRRLVAHNIATERTILTRTAPLTKWGPWVDTLKLAKARFPRFPSYALGDLCEAFGLVPDPEEFPVLAGRTWHDGLFDAVACAKLGIFLAPGW